MSIPVVLEVAVGLIFIYLILSLLASEIQEIIGTLLQWRAEHLKRSVELLLAGQNDSQLQQAEALANQLYSNPLIRGLNQEGRGPIAHLFRQITQVIGAIYRGIFRVRNTFGDQKSGPSYIPSETFASTLLGTLGFNHLGRLVANARFQQFVNAHLRDPIRHIVADLRASLADEFLLEDELRSLEENFDQIIADLEKGRVNLSATLERLLRQIELFIADAGQQLPGQEYLTETVINRLQRLKRVLDGTDSDRIALIKQLEPSLTELITVLDRKSSFYRECVQILRQGQGAPETLRDLQAALEQLDPNQLPVRLRDSLLRLAERAEMKADDLENRLEQFQAEVATWFDRSMARASGVYRRNARGVAFLLGLAIAVTVNADTFYMASRLARDPAVRSLISEASLELVQQANPEAEPDPATIRQRVNELTSNLPIPLGRSPVVLDQQRQDEALWPFWLPRRFLGWLVTGIALSMGSSFWFDLLSKAVRVRSTGATPAHNAEASKKSTD
ncbi:MAG: hypothetical protein ACTS2F_18300 [Thainema sp.]